MQGERYQNTIALLLTVLVFASIPLIVNFLGGGFLWAPVLGALAVLPAAFLREAELDTGLQAPAPVRAALAANLRGEGLEGGAEPDAHRVRIRAPVPVRCPAEGVHGRPDYHRGCRVHQLDRASHRFVRRVEWVQSDYGSMGCTNRWRDGRHLGPLGRPPVSCATAIPPTARALPHVDRPFE